MSKYTYTISMTGYGGEFVLGHVKREIYDYFSRRDLSLDEFENDWDNELKVPKKMRPFNHGAWHDCDDIAHNSGVGLSNGSFIEVRDSNGKVIWESELEMSALRESGCDISIDRGYCADDYPRGNVVIFGQQIEKGSFFEASIETTQKFDRRNLKFIGEDIQDFITLSRLEYDGEEVDGSDGYSTTGKGNTYTFIESQSFNKGKPHNYPNSQLTKWYSSDVDPVRIGMYEISFSNGRIGSIFANWNGSDWSTCDEFNSFIRRSEIDQWRGIKP